MFNDNRQTDISDIQPQGSIVPGRPDPPDPDAAALQTVSPLVLPIRGEKRIVLAPVSPIDATNDFQDQWKKSGTPVPKRLGRQLVERSDYYLKAAMSPYIDYVYIRLPHRGVKNNQPDTTIPAVYRFLINPAQVAVQRTTIDAQVMSRAGWQIGVWGEDSLQINLEGKTAGQYWSFGITDRYQAFSESYRNLIMLQQVFENNGYWFEGEEVNEGPLAADFTRRRIKMHQDVELLVGNFWWYGMFEHLTITQNADNPHLCSFNLSFVAWKERFRNGSPYQNLVANDIQRGHFYRSQKSNAPTPSVGSNQADRTALANILNTPTIIPTLAPATPAAQVSGAQEPDRATVSDPISRDWSPPPFVGTWNAMGFGNV